MRKNTHVFIYTSYEYINVYDNAKYDTVVNTRLKNTSFTQPVCTQFFNIYIIYIIVGTYNIKITNIQF